MSDGDKLVEDVVNDDEEVKEAGEKVEEEKEESKRPPSRKNSQDSSASSSESFEKIDQAEADEMLLNRDQLPPNELLGTEVVDNPLPGDARDVPYREGEKEKYYTQEVSRTAITNLIVYSIAMFSLPFIVMYVSYNYLFLGYLHLPRDEAMLDAGMLAVGTVFMIIASFCYTAYCEEKEAEVEKLREEAEKKKKVHTGSEDVVDDEHGEEQEVGEKEGDVGVDGASPDGSSSQEIEGETKKDK